MNDEAKAAREAENGYRETSGKEQRIRVWAERQDKRSATARDPLINRLRATKRYRAKQAARLLLAKEVPPIPCKAGCGTAIPYDPTQRGPRKEWCSMRCYHRIYQRARRAARKAS